jgi:hypothetical protein
VADIFHEVDEELRAERLRSLFFKGAPWVLGLLALALIAALGFWGYSHWRASVDSKASEAYAAGIESLQGGDEKAALGHFQAAEAAGSKGYKTLALIQQAGLKLRDQKPVEAAAILDRAADVAPSPLLADTARLQAAYVLLDTAPLIELEGRLRPLTEAERPFNAQAREALALALLLHGKATAAREDLVVLSQALDTPEEVRTRAQGVIGLIDSGVAGSLPAALKASLALPPEAVQAAQAAQAMAAMQAQQAQQSQQAPPAGTEP